jgi:hypothetical protein
MNLRVLAAIALVLLIVHATAGVASAEERQVAAAPATVLIPGSMTGAGSYGPLGYWRLCAPLSVALVEWRVGFIERMLKPKEAQKELLDKLATASAAAKKAIASSCPDENPTNGPALLANMERRVNGLLAAIQKVREPYNAFYASLDSRQKALIDGLGPGRRGWRW